MKKLNCERYVRKLAYALSLTMLLGAVFPLPAAAAVSARMARTEEEWAALEDNYLYYDEIEDLIHEYNPTVISNNYDYKEFVDTYGTTNEEISRKYRSLANDLLDNMSGDDDEASGMISDTQTELEAKQLMQSADNNTDDAVTTSLGYAQTEANLVLTAKNAFISYYLDQLELESANLTLRSLENSLALLKVQRTAGTATDTDVITAEKNVSDQQSAVTTATEDIESSRQSLIIMFGWSTTDQPVIGALPELTDEMLDSIDLEADTALALENNYTLSINKRKLENAMYADNIETLNNTISGNEASIRASVNSAYQSLNNARMSLSSAESAYATETVNMQIAESKHTAGVSTQFEYEASQISLEEKELAVETAKLSLLSAYVTYESYVGGLASAG